MPSGSSLKVYSANIERFFRKIDVLIAKEMGGVGSGVCSQDIQTKIRLRKHNVFAA